MQAKLELHDQEDQLARIIDHSHHHHDHVQGATLEQHHQQEPGQSPPGTSHSPSSGPRGIRYQIAPLPSAPSAQPPKPKPAILSKQARLAPALKLESPSDPSPSFLSGSPSGIAGRPGIVAAVVDTKDLPLPNHESEESKLKTKSRHSSLGPPPPSTPLSPHHFRSSQQGTESIPHIPHPSLSTSTPQPPNPGFTGSAAWRRRLSKTRSLTTMTASSVKRSLSSPNVQQAAAMSAEGNSPAVLPYSAGKGRNKLGYHRTSVACGHCRRRKIRCLLSKDDLHGRCSNCIRLKKECNFYPVENTDRRPRSMSKPDITSQDTGSSGSSPSPGLGPGQLSEKPNGYPVSVPVTPTWDPNYEFSSPAFEHQFMQNSLNRPTGTVMGSQSASVSRRSSMAQMHIPTPVKIEQGYLEPVRTWELPSQPESSTHFQGQAVLEDTSAGLSSIIWRATATPVTPVTGSPFTQQNSLAGDSMDNIEDGYWASQAPSRMGSIDHGMNLPFSYQSAYSSDVDLAGAPGIYSTSASTSTASLTASISEASHYGGDQFYSAQWADHGAVANGCGGLEGIRLEPEIFGNQTPFTDDEHYTGADDTTFFPSPHQGTTATLPQ